MRNVQKYRLSMVKEEGYRYDYDGSSPGSIAKILCTMGYANMPSETCGVVAMDVKNRIIGIFEIASGDISTSIVPMRNIFQRLLLCNAACFVVWHNHPSGDPSPSSEDIQVTKRIKDCADLMGIQFQDHIIIGDNCYRSMREKGDMLW